MIKLCEKLAVTVESLTVGGGGVQSTSETPIGCGRRATHAGNDKPLKLLSELAVLVNHTYSRYVDKTISFLFAVRVVYNFNELTSIANKFLRKPVKL